MLGVDGRKHQFDVMNPHMGLNQERASPSLFGMTQTFPADKVIDLCRQFCSLKQLDYIKQAPPVLAHVLAHVRDLIGEAVPQDRSCTMNALVLLLIVVHIIMPRHEPDVKSVTGAITR